MAPETIHLMVSRHSAFYSPLIATMAAGFLRAQGLNATYQILAPGQDAQELIRTDQIDIVQSAVSSSWARLEKNEGNLAVHFAQINQRDGFFLAGRQPDPAFTWQKLEGATLLADHGLQPLVMLQYAAHVNGVDWSKINVIDAGSVEEIDAAFRQGQGDYVHQQGPAPQQIEKDGLGAVVASVGEAMPPVAFSSLMAAREFLATERGRALIRAYRQAREWVKQTPAAEIADREREFFPQIAPEVLAATIARYQQIGCWQGDLMITRELYEQALTVFEHAGQITHRHAYEDVVVSIAEIDQGHAA